ncbi:MAG: hypothetical protein ACPL4K_02195 [Candidatus Margulisiibacteriota bacterium]
MNITPNKRLFWFLKDGVDLDLDDPPTLDMYVQQVITHGKTDDIKHLLKIVKPQKLKESLSHLKGFLPDEVEKFWEDFIGSTYSASEGNP